MNTLVTGATGFVGSVLVRHLVERGDSVAVLHRATSKLDLLQPVTDHVEHRIGDVREPESLASAFDGVDRVYHTAGYVSFGGPRDRELLVAVNVEGTAHVVNAALRAGVERMVHTSSIAALGRPESGTGFIDETATWQPSRHNTAYALSKYRAELEVQRGVAEGLDAVLVNPSLVLGRGRAGDNTMRIIESVRDEKLPGIPSGGTCVVDVEDVAVGHIRAMERGRTGDRYLLGGENLRWTEILTTLAEAFGVDPPRRVVSQGWALALATASEAFAFLTRTRPLLTRETARISAAFHRYSNRKAVEELGLTFRPFRQTAERIAREMSSSGQA